MAVIPLSGSGSFPEVTGHYIGWVNDLLAIQGAASTTFINASAGTPTRVTEVQVDGAAATPPLYTVLNGITSQASQLQQSSNTFLQTLQSISMSALIAMADQSVPLTQLALPNALSLLITQMIGTADSFNANVVAVGAQTAVGTPTGNAIFVVSLKDGAGRPIQMTYPETLLAAITQDSQGGATLNNEPYLVTGENAAQGGNLSWNWLTTGYGSGCSFGGNLVDGRQNAPATGNLLTNSSFSVATTANSPDNFTIVVGVAGTDIFQGAVGYGGSGYVEFLGTAGALLDTITQTFNTTPTTLLGVGGTPTVLVPGFINNSVLCLQGWIKTTSTPGAGVLEFSLIDGNGSTIQDDSGNNNLFTKSLTAVSTTYLPVNGTFRMPAALPVQPVKLKMRLSTAITSTHGVFLSNFSLAQMVQAYNGGPYVQGYSGSIPVQASAAQADAWTFAVTNTVGAFMKGFWRLWDPANIGGSGLPNFSANNGFYIPATTSPTISDTLVA